MKTTVKLTLALAALPLLITACATPQPPQAFHNSDHSALIIESLNGQTGKIIQPTDGKPADCDKIIATAMSLPRHTTAVVILDNYSEAQIGQQFRDRGTPWFLGLRGLGYQHIVFLQGNGSSNPEGLPTLVAYE